MRCQDRTLVSLLLPSLALVIGNAYARRLSRQAPIGEQPQCGKPQTDPQLMFVMGGKEIAPKHLWPWLAHIQIDSGGRGPPTTVHCGATMITKSLLITAAHCLAEKSVDNMWVILWSHNITSEDGYKVAIRRTFIHPKFTKENGSMAYDLAIIELVFPYEQMMPVCLPCRSDEARKRKYTTCVIAGWGVTGDQNEGTTVAHHAITPLVDSAKCSRLWKGAYDKTNMMCAGAGGANRVSTCMGDSGGPLMCKSRQTESWVLAGVTSWGSLFCGRKPAVYGDVEKMLDWIYETAAQLTGSSLSWLSNSGDCERPPVTPPPKTVTVEAPKPTKPPANAPIDTTEKTVAKSTTAEFDTVACGAGFYEMKPRMFLIANQAPGFVNRQVGNSQHCQSLCCENEQCLSVLYYPDFKECYLYKERYCDVSSYAMKNGSSENVIYYGEPCN